MTGALPSGTVTFLFTDIEGSTRLLHKLGDAYADALVEHRRVLRDAFARHGGVEVDTQGDAFFIAFERASDALGAARDAQRSLQGPIRVRMGLHTGEPLVTAEGYVGIDVHRAARIAAAGHGGQILLSQSTRDLADTDELRDLGEHRLKDLTASERIYQLGDGDFPPLKTLNATNLPLPPEPLVGRKKELGDVLRAIRVDGVRLVTLTGPGGMGKTRFALEAAADLVEDFAHGVWFVDLAPLREPELVMPTAAHTLGAGGDLVDYVRDRALLLLLDNFEQVIDAASDVARLLERCPNVVVLATSREPLHVGGEREYPLDSLAEAAAVELFGRRAEAVAPAFDGADDEVAELCARLDGLPLAIELAAARAKLLRPRELLERLDQRLSLLTGPRRDVPARQRTVRGTIEWSYELLPEEERRLLAALSVFSGGFGLEAAEMVCGAHLDLLTSLVDKSLVRRNDDGRFAFLEVIREFAAECLPPTETEDFRRRHAEYFGGAADGRWRELVLGGTDWRAFVGAEHPNLHSALEWAIANEHGDTALAITSGTWPFWLDGGYVRQGEQWLEAALKVPSVPVSERRAHSLGGLGDIRLFQGNLEGAEEAITRSIDLYRQLDFPRGIAAELTQLADVVHLRGDRRRARALAEEALVVRREHVEELGSARTLLTLAELALADGDLDHAEALYEDALADIRTNAPESSFLPYALIGVGEVARRRGDHVAAVERHAGALRLALALRDQLAIVECFDALVAVHSERGDEETAARIAGAAERVREETGLTQLPSDRPTAKRVEPAWTEGRTLTLEAAVEYATGGLH